MKLQMQLRPLTCKTYPSDVSDEEWAFVLPYLTLCRDDAPQRTHDLREVFNGARYLMKTGAPWRWLPNDFPPWAAVYQQTQRWIKAGVFESMVHDLRLFIRLGEGRAPDPSAVILGDHRRAHAPEYARERASGGLRRPQTEEGLEAPHGG